MKSKVDYRKYAVIAKVGKDKFVKYRTSHPEKSLNFLINKFKTVFWANWYERKTERQFLSWGKNTGWKSL